MNLIFFTTLKFILIVLPLLISIAFLTLLERKFIASIQNRKGPNIVGTFGILQPLADGLKLFLKEIIIPSYANPFLFILAPILTFSLSLVSWVVIPINGISISNTNFDLLYILAISSLSIYGIILAGWASNSKYALLGALRSTAQMISYEVFIGLLFIILILFSGSLNLIEIMFNQSNLWYFFPLFPVCTLLFISILAETNRAPFDLPEAEAELVAGYNIEYSGICFALFFLGEYSNMILMSLLMTILFLGGWHMMGPIYVLLILSFCIPQIVWLSLKVLFFLSLFIIIRAVLPRYRYDQLMMLGWKIFLPLSLSYLLLYIIFMYMFFIW